MIALTCPRAGLVDRLSLPQHQGLALIPPDVPGPSTRRTIRHTRGPFSFTSALVPGTSAYIPKYIHYVCLLWEVGGTRWHE